jgi:DNA-binding MarR family transcriptional regulator
MSGAAKVTPIDSPDIRWSKLPAEQKLLIARHVRSDKSISDGAFRVYSVLFDHGWKRRRSRLSRAQVAEEAGMPEATVKRHLKTICEKGYVAKRRFAYVVEWILDPTDAERDVAKLRPEMAQNCDISKPRILRNARQSSSTNAQASEASEVQTSFADDDEKPKPPKNPPLESRKATRVPEVDATSDGTRKEFDDWFNEHYADRISAKEVGKLSRKDYSYIEQRMASYGFSWKWFLDECRIRCSRTGAKNPIGLVKSIADDFANRVLPPKVAVMPLPAQESKPCQTCKSRAGLLPDGTPCPDCPLGRDLKLQQDFSERKYGKGKRSPGGQL